MRSELLKPLLLQAAKEVGIDTVCGENWGKVAEILGERLTLEDTIRKKRSNIALVRKSIERQQAELDVEERQLQELCPHLSGGAATASEDGESIEYTCETCGAEVIL